MITNSPKRPGISEITLLAAEICFSDYPEPGSIEIPYWTLEGKLSAFKRWRLPSVRSNGQKYYQEPGSGVYAYFPPGFFRRSAESRFNMAANSALLLEGEFKALSMSEEGIYTIGLPSFNVYLKDENKHRRLLRDLQVVFIREKIKTIYFLGDADTATNFEFSRHAVFLARAVFPAQVFLPRIPIDQPKGVDDCKDLFGNEFREFFSGIIKEAIALDRKCNETSLALLLFEREADRIKGLKGIERERQFRRIVKMVGAAQTLGETDATVRLRKLAAKVMAITVTELKKAINGHQAQPSITEELPRGLETEAQSVVKAIDAFYDVVRKEYALREGTPIYQSVNEAQFKRVLRARGLSRAHLPGRQVSQLDIVLDTLRQKRFVQYVGSLAGRDAGYYHENGIPFLVTSSPCIIEPNLGVWKTLETVFANLFWGDTEPFKEQQTAFYSWLLVAYQAARARKFQPGQALALAGPVDAGKSLTQKLITLIVGGRSAKAAMFLQGRTDFNSELFGAEHLYLEDENVSTSHSARMALAAAIKNIVANEQQPCHAKGRDIVNLCPWWRVTISLNDRSDRMLVLPPLEHDDIAGKIILLRATTHKMPMPTETVEQKAKFWQTLKEELPPFLYWLTTDFKIPPDWRDSRFGVKAWHNPGLLAELEELSPAIALLELIDRANIWTKQIWDSKGQLQSIRNVPWRGTALQLRAALLDNRSTRHDAQQILNWTNATGQYLNDLHSMRGERIKTIRTHSTREYEIFP
jgi:hypothetical protein